MWSRGFCPTSVPKLLHALLFIYSIIGSTPAPPGVSTHWESFVRPTLLMVNSYGKLALGTSRVEKAVSKPDKFPGCGATLLWEIRNWTAIGNKSEEAVGWTV